jgi:hypothetical protein
MASEITDAVETERNRARKNVTARKKQQAVNAKASKTNNASLPTAPLADNPELVEDLTRYTESILSEKEVRKRHRLTEKDWVAMGENDDLVRKIDDRKLQRIRDGSCKRERAQRYVVEAPRILSDIMMNNDANNRHRIDAAARLDAIAEPLGQAAGGDSSRFVIQINLGADTDGKEIIETFDKAIAIGIEDDNAPIPAAIAAKRNKDDGGGNHI